MKAGFARLDVTPPNGTCIASKYFYFVPAKGFLEPLEVNALAVADEERTVVMLAADFAGITQKYMDIFRERIVQRTGLSVENVCITALHQHTSVVVSDPTETDTPVCDPVVLEWWYRKFCDVAEMALADLQEATLRVGARETAEQISFIRRNEKVEDSNAPDGYRYVSFGPEADNTVYLARFVREGAKDIALVNFGTHPVVVGGPYFSNDWPGAVRRFVEKDIADVHCMLINGFQGDVNHFNYYTATSAQRRSMKGHGHAEYMGRVIANAVVALWENTVPVACDRVESKAEILYTKTRTDGEERYKEARELCEAYEKDHSTANAKTLAEAQRIVEIRHAAPIYQRIPMTLIEIGGLVIVGIGAEPFTAYATGARAILRDRFVMTACLMNGYECYMPTKEAFQKKDYAVGRSRFTPALQEEAMEMIKKLAACER